MSEIDRVLSTRIDAMAGALDRLREVSDDVTAARGGLDKLGEQISDLGGTLKSAITLSNKLRAGLERVSEDMDSFEITHNENYRVSAMELREHLASAKSLEAEVRVLRTTLDISISSSIRRLRRWSALTAGRDATVEIDDETAGALSSALLATPAQEDPWSYFREEVQERCENLFAQYVDLLGGIALRDQGLERVSRHADVLVPLLLKSIGKDGVLAVPSRHTGQALVQARHIRIPMPPGWTLWSLPLVARGVGELLRAAKLSHLPLASLVPDVFGAFALGPSYCFAALLLDFDPTDAADRRRAAAVFHVLRRTGAGDDRQRFGALADEIHQEWTVAVGTVAQVDADVVDSPAALDALYREVSVRCDPAAYLARDRWDEVESLAAGLARDDVAVDCDDLRDLLNAMWLKRWQGDSDLTTIEQNAIRAAEHATDGETRTHDFTGSGGREANR